jgi:predicted glycosyltransferase
MIRNMKPRRKIWIDLDNSPHVPFFAPIIKELERAGYGITLTARDCFQVCGLADLLGLSYRRVGRHYGKNLIVKMAGLCIRAGQLVPEVVREKPVLALSHGSRSQLLLAKALRVPSVVIVDYEFARVSMFIRPDWLITPEIIADDAVQRGHTRILKYPGIKEDVYVPDFRPDSGILTTLGLTGAELIATVRPPATEAHYHRPESDSLFAGVLEFLGSQPGVKMVVLPRNERQAGWIHSKWAHLIAQNRLILPNGVLDGLNLMWHSDLVISGGGTMNREAAALGIPVYSIFGGKIGAVDRYLSSVGRLILIGDKKQIKNRLVLSKRASRPATPKSQGSTLTTITRHITGILQQRYPEPCPLR